MEFFALLSDVYIISRIENNASDIRLSTLMRIVKEGHLQIRVPY